jgi:uncharacterized cupredoxin-like copper-binding protein
LASRGRPNKEEEMRRRLSFRVLPMLVSVAAVAAAGSSVAGAAVQAHPAAVAKTINVKATEYHFALSAGTLAKPGVVTFVVKNAGHIKHDFKIDGKKTALIAPGKVAKLTVKFAKAGKYAYLCTVSGHAALGMKGVLTVK